MSQNKSLSTQEVAQILHVSKSTIYDLIKKGEIIKKIPEDQLLATLKEELLNWGE